MFTTLSSAFEKAGKTLLGSYYKKLKLTIADSNGLVNQYSNLVNQSTQFEVTYQSPIYKTDSEDELRYKKIQVLDAKRLEKFDHVHIYRRDENEISLVITVNNKRFNYALEKIYYYGQPLQLHNKDKVCLYKIVTNDKGPLTRKVMADYIDGLYLDEANKLYSNPYSSTIFTITEKINSVGTLYRIRNSRESFSIRNFIFNTELNLIRIINSTILFITFILPVKILLQFIVKTTRLILPLPVMLVNTLGRMLYGFIKDKSWEGAKKGWEVSLEFNSALFEKGFLGYFNSLLSYNTLLQDLKNARANKAANLPSPQLGKIVASLLINLPLNLIRTLILTVISISLMITCSLISISHLVAGVFLYFREGNYSFKFAAAYFNHTQAEITKRWPYLKDPTKDRDVAIDATPSLFKDLSIIKEAVSFYLLDKLRPPVQNKEYNSPPPPASSVHLSPELSPSPHFETEEVPPTFIPHLTSNVVGKTR